jgi:cell division inhibitor SepF
LSRRELLEEDELDESEGWLSKLKRKIGLEEYVDEDDDSFDEPEVVRRGPSMRDASRNNPPMLRVHTPRPTEISVWVSPRTLTDAQSAADKLKERRPVLINLERTDEEVARRIVDFISGVTYALDGYYQRIGNKVFLFTPSNTVITVEDDLDQEQRTLFFDQE